MSTTMRVVVLLRLDQIEVSEGGISDIIGINKVILFVEPYTKTVVGVAETLIRREYLNYNS